MDLPTDSDVGQQETGLSRDQIQRIKPGDNPQLDRRKVPGEISLDQIRRWAMAKLLHREGFP